MFPAGQRKADFIIGLTVIRSSNYVVASKSYQNSLVQFTGITTVNKKMYIDILRRLRDAVRGKGPEKWRTNSWSLLHTARFLVKDFLKQRTV
jgi:hypothetical protein